MTKLFEISFRSIYVTSRHRSIDLLPKILKIVPETGLTYLYKCTYHNGSLMLAGELMVTSVAMTSWLSPELHSTSILVVTPSPNLLSQTNSSVYARRLIDENARRFAPFAKTLTHYCAAIFARQKEEDDEILYLLYINIYLPIFLYRLFVK